MCLQSVPAAHEQEGAEERDVLSEQRPGAQGRGAAQLLVDGPEEVIAQPIAEGDVPAAPELRRVLREPRPIEVGRQRDAHHAPKADGEQGVTREVEVEIDRIAVHVRSHVACHGARGIEALEPIAIHQFGQNELVQRAKQDEFPARDQGRAVQPRPSRVEVTLEALVAINGACEQAGRE